MDKDYSELIEYLDKKFANIEKDINILQTGQTILQTGQTNLQIKILENASEIKKNRELMATKAEVNTLVDAVDAYMKQGDEYRQEVVMLGNKVDRHEKWLEAIAKKLDLKLEY